MHTTAATAPQGWRGLAIRAILLLCAMTLHATAPAQGAALATLHGESMGTTWQVSLPAERADAATQAAIEDELARLTAQLSAWVPDSALSRFNRSAGEWQALPRDLASVLGHALWLAEDTDGAFDPSVGALVALWSFAADGSRRTTPPTAGEIAAAGQRIGWQRIRFDAAQSRARQPGGLILDINALGPGYAVDRIAALLQRRGVDAFLVELGGELRAAGRKPDGQPWRVAVERPAHVADADAGFDLVIALEDAALGSSGDYRSGFIHNGRRYAHTLDPRSGEPVQHGLAAVTVLAPTAMQADALAAALLVLGPEAGWQYAASRGVAAVFTRREADGGYTRRLSAPLLTQLGR